MKKIIKMGLLCCAMAMILGLSVSANTPYESYRYDERDTALPMPSGYDAVRALTAEHMGIAGLHPEATDETASLPSSLSEPSDLFYAPDGHFYIVDSGNNRIIKLDASLKAVRDYIEFTQPSGEKTTLKNPTGIFVDGAGMMYIADNGNLRVLICDAEGQVKAAITKPESSLYPENVAFSASKVIKDNKGTTYVVVKGLYFGAAAFNANYEFIGFFGFNRVQLSAAELASVLWRKIFPRDQEQYQEKYVPIEISNLAVDTEGFIYSCTDTMNISEKIKKLNAMSINIMHEKSFGDKEIVWGRGGAITDTQFVDISVDENGLINALDMSRGRVFQYDPDGQLMFIFGGIGNQLGLFSKPTAIKSVNGNIYVLDATKGSVTVFQPNRLAASTHEAIQLYNKGLYSESIRPWQEVLRIDSGNTFAYASIGKSYFEAGEYKLAMENFKTGQDRLGYSKAHKEHRTQLIRSYFPVLGVSMILLILLAVFLFKRRQWAPALAKVGIRIKTEKAPKKMAGFRYIGYILRHPVEGFEEMKYNKGGKMSIAWLFVLLWFFVSIIAYDSTGFIFNRNKPGQINVGIIFLSTIFLFLLWVISNWCFCTLLNGEGRMKQIFIHSAYALVPYLACTLLVLILSNVLSADEGVFLTWLTTFGMIWTGLLLFFGMLTLHNYTGGKTVASALLTLAGMLIITFLIVLAFTLVMQMISFVVTITRELEFRQY